MTAFKLTGSLRHGQKHRLAVKRATRTPVQVFPNGVIYSNGDVEFWSAPRDQGMHQLLADLKTPDAVVGYPAGQER